MNQTALEMYRGTTQELDIVVTKGGSAVDISRWTFWLTAKARASDPDASAAFRVSGGSFVITDGPAGEVSCMIQPSVTAGLQMTGDKAYVFDIRGMDETGDISLLAVGTITVHMGVTADVP
jgi:hypothetical protein